MQMYRWQYVTIALLIVSALGYLRWERRLDSCLGECINTVRYHAGHHRIALMVIAEQPGDNGNATITIAVDDKPRAQLTAYFNYDTLMDVPVGYVHYWWQDGDLYPDLQIRLTNPIAMESYYIGSRDGELHVRTR